MSSIPETAGTTTFDRLPWDVKEFGEPHTVPHTDFTVQGEMASCSDVVFYIYDRDGTKLGSVKLSLHSFQDGEYRCIDDIDKNLHTWSVKSGFLSNGNYIRIDRLSISGKEDEKGLDQVGKILLQTIMEFAKKMNANARIYGDLYFCSSKRLHGLGMSYYSEGQNPTVEERANARKVRKHEIVTIYVSDACATKFHERIQRKPIFLTK